MREYCVVAEAIETNNRVWLLDLIHSGIHINHNDLNTSGTYLLYAIDNNKPEMVKLLLENGADPNMRRIIGSTENNLPPIYGDSPLECATNQDNLEILQILFQHRAKIRKEDQGSIVKFAKSVPVAELLFKNGAHTKDLDGFITSSIVKPELYGVLQLCIKKGANVRARRIADSNTLLHEAMTAEMLELLIQHGAEINAVDEKGVTPLHNAVYANRLPVVRVLLTHGADVNAKDSGGDTPLDWLIKNAQGWEKFDEPMAELLVSKGAIIHDELISHQENKELRRIFEGIKKKAAAKKTDRNG